MKYVVKTFKPRHHTSFCDQTSGWNNTKLYLDKIKSCEDSGKMNVLIFYQVIHEILLRAREVNMCVWTLFLVQRRLLNRMKIAREKRSETRERIRNTRVIMLTA